MKKVTQAMAFVSIIQICSCNQVPEKTYSFRVEVANEDGVPVQEARVEASKEVLVAESPIPTSKYERAHVLTDRNGIATMTFNSVGTPGGVVVSKDGHYLTTATAEWDFPRGYDKSKEAKAEIKAELKSIKDPVPMVVHPKTGLLAKELEVEYAFDLELGEMLPPHGKGKHADVLVMIGSAPGKKGQSGANGADLKATFRFSNPLDGVIEFEVQPKDGAKGSVFISDYLAPDVGYQALLERAASNDVQKTAAWWDYYHSLQKKAYYFRVRTKTDDSGRIVSSNYGKIYGPIELIVPEGASGGPAKINGKAAVMFSEVYFNPASNDRNVECDTKVNLLKTLDEYGQPLRIERP